MIIKVIFLLLFLTLFFFFPELKIEASGNNVSPVENASDNLGNAGTTRSISKEEIFKQVNNQRRKKGLSDLRWNDDLEKLARNYSRQMADGNFFSHYDRNGNSIVQRAKAMKVIGWRKIGENLFKSEPFKNLDKFAVDRWMESPMHRANILDRRYNTTGIGIAEARNGTIYITQVFTQN